MRLMAMTMILSAGFLLTPTTKASDYQPQEISVPKKLMKQLKSFEPSAILAIAGSENYLVAIDDTTEEDAPYLFLMDINGKVNKEPVLIEGLVKMTDIESLSTHNGYVYAMSSQSRNKKGKVLKERNLFVQGKLEGMALTDVTVMELRSELLKVLPTVADTRVSSMNNQFDKLLEIEASYVKNGMLYVGLKDSQPRPGTGLVLELGPVETIFSQGKLNGAIIRVAAELDFAKSGGTVEKISDITLAADGSLIVAATLEEGGGSIWTFANEKLTKQVSYQSEKPEGITLTGNGELLVVFDQGEEQALFTTFKMGN